MDVKTAYTKYFSELYLYAMNFAPSHSAEDIVMGIFAKLLENEQFEQIENPRAYLYTTVRNAALNVRKHDHFIKSDIIPEEFEEVNIELFQITINIIKGYRASFTKQQLEVLDGILNEMDSKEIAVKMGVKPVTVRSTKRSLIDRLKKLMYPHKHLFN